MKTAVYLLAIATILVAPHVSAGQSVNRPESTALRFDIQASDAELSPEVQRLLSRGDELSSHLRFDGAAQEYRRAADVARREGHLPSLTSWKVATAYYYADNLIGSAAALDQLTSEAAMVGDLQTEALAIYYAAWSNGKLGRKTEATARIARLGGLLRSRFMPVATRDLLSSWLRTSKEGTVGLVN